MMLVPIHAECEDLLTRPIEAAPFHYSEDADDSGPVDLADLWRDLGGGD